MLQKFAKHTSNKTKSISKEKAKNRLRRKGIKMDFSKGVDGWVFDLDIGKFGKKASDMFHDSFVDELDKLGYGSLVAFEKNAGMKDIGKSLFSKIKGLVIKPPPQISDKFRNAVKLRKFKVLMRKKGYGLKNKNLVSREKQDIFTRLGTRGERVGQYSNSPPIRKREYYDF